MLAKLLAKENITVRFGNYSTAFFEPKTRVLGMPMWNAESKQVSDLLVGHEVGHALYTPQDGIEKFKERFPNIPFDICNIIEDVRIERMIQDTYPGLVHSFREGYRSFIAKDLFKINGVDLAKLTVADRINLHAKVGHLIDVPLTAEESAIYDTAYAAKSFEDVLDVCQQLYSLVEKTKQDKAEGNDSAPNKSTKVKKERSSATSDPTQRAESKSNEKSDADSESEGSDGESDSEDSKEEDEKKDGEPGKGKKKADEKEADDEEDGSGENGESDKPSDGGEKTESNGEGEQPDDSESDDDPADDIEYAPNTADEFSASHQRAFDQGTAAMQEKVECIQVNVPTVEQMMRAVTPLKKVIAARRADTKYDEIMGHDGMNAGYRKFKDSTKKHVQVLIKEFERRKAAYQYSRARISTTGTIDLNRLHAYKYEDQIFRSMTTLADAKNHGMAFFIDYSGSMGRTIGSVIEQTIQLVTFCKAAGIPFVVYGFTSGYLADESRPPVTYAPGYSMNFDTVNIFEILNSSLKKLEFDRCIKEMYAMSYFRKSYGLYGTSTYVLFNSGYEIFGRTPLLETIVIASELVKRFRSQHTVQRMSTTFLTDGDPCLVHMHDNTSDKMFRKNNESYGRGYEMRFGGESVNWSYSYPKNAMAALIRGFRNVTGSTVIGYFIADHQRAFKSHCIDAIRNVDRKVSNWSDAADKFKSRSREIRQNDGILPIVNGGGYDILFAFDGRDVISADYDEDFETDLDMDDLDSTSTQNKLAKQFTKYASSKKSARIFVHKFAELIS